MWWKEESGTVVSVLVCVAFVTCGFVIAEKNNCGTLRKTEMECKKNSEKKMLQICGLARLNWMFVENWKKLDKSKWKFNFFVLRAKLMEVENYFLFL